MAIEERKKRLAILNKINHLNDNIQCECERTPTRALIKQCSRCDEIAKLGKLLTGSSTEKRIRKEKVEKKKSYKEYDGKPLKYKLRDGVKVANWQEALEWLEENSRFYTVNEMAKKLGVTKMQVRNAYNRYGFEYKKDVDIFKLYIFDELVGHGSIPEISKQIGYSESTLRKWKNNQGRKGERLVLVND